MSGLLDFLQAASNSVAGNVTGPVDLITLALRKAGLPVPEDSVGTSQWAKQKGLMRDVAPGAARVAGETAGILGPMLATHYAPQIAGGLLKAGENLAAPTTLRPEAGAIVWHGSPHKFDKFDSSRIGTGEGAQAYGHGLYLAESPEVATNYQRQLGKSQVELGGNAFQPAELSERLWKQSGNDSPEFLRGVMDAVHEMTATGKAPTAPADLAGWLGYGPMAQRQGYSYAANALKEGKAGAGNLYKVDLPDDAIARMLDYDATLAQQPEMVRQALRQAGWINDSNEITNTISAGQARGKDLYSIMAGRLNVRVPGPQSGDAKASEELRRLGVPGLKYLDQGSRGGGQGTRNYVTFRDDLLTILERNGVPIR